MLDDALLSRRLEWEDARTMAGGTIELVPDESAATAVTLAVESAEQRAGPPGFVQFTLLFRGPVDPIYAQATYRFRHAQLGEYAIFITPIARDAAGVRYEAVFSYAG